MPINFDLPGSEGIGYRNYILNHNSSNLGYDRLLSIQEKSGDNTLSHSPITFNYTSTTAGVSTTDISTTLGFTGLSQTNSEVVTLDLTGDGKMDLIVLPKSASQKNKFWVLKDLDNGFNFPQVVNSGTFEDIFPVTWLTHNNKILSQQGLAVVQNSTNN